MLTLLLLWVVFSGTGDWHQGLEHTRPVLCPWTPGFKENGNQLDYSVKSCRMTCFLVWSKAWPGTFLVWGRGGLEFFCSESIPWNCIIFMHCISYQGEAAKNGLLSSAWWHIPGIPGKRRQKQEFKVILSYRGNLKPIWVAWDYA